MGEATDKEIVDICNGFMLSSPPGEFVEVVTDIRALIKNESLLNVSAPNTFRQYNQEQLLAVDSPGHQHKVIISEFGETAPGEYLDPKGNQIIKFDHIKQQVTGKKELAGKLDASIEPTRKAFEDAAFAYIADHYPDGACTVYGKGKIITICIQSSKYNPNNFWNGRWRSVWQCTLTGASTQLKASVKIQVHYYENGNVQLNTDTTKTATALQTTDPVATAKEALAAIKKVEQEFAKALDTSYNTMSDTTFKALRRALPITRTKINWAIIRNYKVAGGEEKKK